MLAAAPGVLVRAKLIDGPPANVAETLKLPAAVLAVSVVAVARPEASVCTVMVVPPPAEGGAGAGRRRGKRDVDIGHGVVAGVAHERPQQRAEGRRDLRRLTGALVDRDLRRGARQVDQVEVGWRRER